MALGRLHLLVLVQPLLVFGQLVLSRGRVSKALQQLVKLVQTSGKVTNELHHRRVLVVNLGRFSVKVDDAQVAFLIPVPGLIFNGVITNRDYQVTLLEQLVPNLVAE